MPSTFETLRDHAMVRMDVPAKTADRAADALEIAKKLFGLLESEKRACFLEKERSRWGWRPQANFGRGPEIWQIDRTAPEGAWPKSMRDEHKLLMDLAEESLELFKNLFRETFDIYGSEEDASLEHRDTMVIIRMLHYAPYPSPVAFPPHQDFGWATAFMGETYPSLKGQDERGNWISGDSEPNSWLIITGKLMRVFTMGALQPLVHQVTMPETDRYSLVGVLDVGESVPNLPKYEQEYREFTKEREDRTRAAVDFMKGTEKIHA
jgi:hypothetical protein